MIRSYCVKGDSWMFGGGVFAFGSRHASAGRFCFRLAGSGLFSLSGGFFLVVLAAGFFLTFCCFHQMAFLYSRLPRLLRGVCRWR